ncbi:MAG: ABC transporter ATP-binding protein [Actinomycetota bacterium]
MDPCIAELPLELVTKVLEARALYRFFHAGDEEVQALRGVNITADRGEMVALVGPSGSGKSTLLACIAGIDEPDGGHVVIEGNRITRRSEVRKGRLRARSLGVVLQSNNLLEHLTVIQNVALAQKLAAGQRTTDPLGILRVIGIANRANSYPSMLSGGEAVRASIAVAVANDPPLVIADEPTGELDSANEEKVLELFAELCNQGAAFLIATHSNKVAARATRVVHLRDGVLVDG